MAWTDQCKLSAVEKIDKVVEDSGIFGQAVHRKIKRQALDQDSKASSGGKDMILTGEILIDLDIGKGADGEDEIQGIPHAMITVGNEQIDITGCIEAIFEKHMGQLETLVEEESRKEREAYLKDGAAESLQYYLGMKN